jgi:hypothetical protein
MLPDQTKLITIKQEVDEFLYNNQVVVIKSQQDFLTASDTLKIISQKIKKVEEKRKEYTAPLDESKKRIMADFQAITKPLEEFVAAVKEKMIEWQKIEQKRLDEEQKKLEAEALKKAKAEGKSEVEVAIVNNIKTQRADFSTATLKKIWTFEVISEIEIPREYLTVDEKKIKEAIKNGVREIKGVKIYQEESLAIR